MHRLQMVDLSSNNEITDLRSLWNYGVRVLCLKVSEGHGAGGYSWADSPKHAETWRKLGGLVGHYHFMHPGGPAEGRAEADFFLGHLKASFDPRLDFVVVDHETKGEGNAEIGTFIDRVHARLPHTRGLQYSYASFLTGNKIRRQHGWGLWVAAYGATPPTGLPKDWPSWTAWQYTSTGAVPGVRGAVDISHIRRSMVQPTLHRGDRNAAVLDAKAALYRAGYKGYVLHSPQYGRGMARALGQFKKQHGWTRPDGAVLGHRAWDRLNAY